MRAFAVALVLIALFAVPPRPAAAQSPECDVAGMLPPGVQWLFGTPYVRRLPAQIEGVPVTVQICAPQSQNLTADQLVDLARRALPVLDQLADAPVTGSRLRPILIIDTETMYSYGADGYITADDVIHLHPRSMRSTVIHELAHYWASRENFADWWMVEAYAEYLTGLAAAELGEPFQPHPLSQWCAGVPLVSLASAMPDRRLTSCAYSVGPTIFHELAAAVGADTLRLAIRDLSQGPEGVSSWALLNRLETDSGLDLTTIVRERVFPQAMNGDLMRRATLLAELRRAHEAAPRHGLVVPDTIADLIFRRNLDGAAAELNALLKLLATADLVQQRCAAGGLACGQPLVGLLPGAANWQAWDEQLSGALGVLDVYDRISALGAALGAPVPVGLQQAAAGLDPGALGAMQAAEAALIAAQGVEAQCAGADIVCRGYWAPAWAQGDPVAVQAAVGSLTALLGEAAALEQRCAAAERQCGLLWRAALERDGIDAARGAVGRLGGLLERAAAVEAACGKPDEAGGPGAACRAYWQRALADGEAAAGAALDDLEAMLEARRQVAPECANAGWPCDDAWAGRLTTAGPDQARATLVAQAERIADLSELEQRLRAVNGPARLVDGILPAMMRIEGRVIAAKSAFADGAPDDAALLLTRAVEQREVLNRAVPWAVGIIALAVVAIIALRRPWRRPRGRRGGGGKLGAESTEQLLAQLLGSSPDDPRARP